MTRSAGVDTARGWAVLGMFIAHLGLVRHDGLFSPTGWFFINDGRPSALFAFLAGLGLAFMTRGAFESGDPQEWRRQRIRLLKRVAILAILGWALTLLGTPVAVILPSYAVMFVLTLPFLRWQLPRILGAAAVVVTLAPILVLASHSTLASLSEVQIVPLLDELLTGYYPAIAWVAYLLVGLAVGRLDLRQTQVQVRLVAVGSALALIGYATGHLLSAILAPKANSVLPLLVSIEPHANSTPEMLGNTGVAISVLGLMLLATRLTVLRVLLTPVTAIGAMSLTVYSLHIVYLRVLGDDAVWYPESNEPLIWLILVTAALATIWHLTLGKGPFERAVSALIR